MMGRGRGSPVPREKNGMLSLLGSPPVLLFCVLAPGLLQYTLTKHIYTGIHNHAFTLTESVYVL